jgi:hypothetical protein
MALSRKYIFGLGSLSSFGLLRFIPGSRLGLEHPREKLRCTFRQSMYRLLLELWGIRNPQHRRFPGRSRKYTGSVRKPIIDQTSSPEADV